MYAQPIAVSAGPKITAVPSSTASTALPLVILGNEPTTSSPILPWDPSSSQPYEVVCDQIKLSESEVP